MLDTTAKALWQDLQCFVRKVETTWNNRIKWHTWNFRLCEIIARSWNNTFFCCLVYFLLFSKNNAVSCLGFWLLGNACQPDLCLRFLDGKLRFLDGKLRRFKFLSAPLWEVQVPQNGPKPKNARRQKKIQVPQKSNNFWKSKKLTSFGRSRYDTVEWHRFFFGARQIAINVSQMFYCNSQDGLMWSASENMAVHAPTLRECVVQIGVDRLLLGLVSGFLQRLDDVIWMVPSCYWSFCWNKSTFAFNMFETFSKRNPFRDVQVWMQLKGSSWDLNWQNPQQESLIAVGFIFSQQKTWKAVIVVVLFTYH